MGEYDKDPVYSEVKIYLPSARRLSSRNVVVHVGEGVVKPIPQLVSDPQQHLLGPLKLK